MTTIAEDIYTALDDSPGSDGNYLGALRDAGYDTEAIDFDQLIEDEFDISGALREFITPDTNVTRGAAKRIAGEILDADKADRRAALDALGFSGIKRRDLDLDDLISAVESAFEEIVAGTATAVHAYSDLSQYETL